MPELSLQDIASISMREIDNEQAKRSLNKFIKKTKRGYQSKWFHKYLCDVLDKFLSGEIKNLIITLPPQHGKSEIASRRFPAYAFGKHPDKKISISSYGKSLASKFNRDVQRIIESPEYGELFPRIRLNGVKNNELMEIPEFGGELITIGIQGSMTGKTVDIGIIDDPIKGRKEAESKTYRDALWDFYTDVFETRMHNGSQRLISTTRWHEDDLVGRLIAQMENDPDAEQFTVINIPALMDNPNDSVPNDPREIGEALFPEKHNAQKLLKLKAQSLRGFNSLQQGRPSPPDGDVIKKEWFPIISWGAFASIIMDENNGDFVPDYFIDGAYTEDETNDPSSILCGIKIGYTAYITNVASVWKDFPNLIRYINKFCADTDIAERSRMYIEPKASGLSIAQFLKKHTSINVISNIDFMDLKDPKVVRAQAVTPFLEAQRVVLVAGPWNKAFLDEVGAFPNGAHDDRVDNLVMMASRYFLNEPGGHMSWMSLNG